MTRKPWSVSSVALALVLSFGSSCSAASDGGDVRLYPLPVGTHVDGVAIDDRGDIAVGFSDANLGYGNVANRIAEWNGRRFVPRSLASLGMHADGMVEDGMRGTLEMPISFAPDGTLYVTRADMPLSCAGPCDPEHVVLAIRGAKTTFVRAEACGSKADGISAVATTADGRVVARGDFDVSAPFVVLNDDEAAIPIGVVISGTTCRDIGAGSIAALDGTFAAGNQRYIGAKKASPYFGGVKDRYVAIRWTGNATTVLGPGFAEGVNASGTCVGNDGSRPVVWRDGSITRLESNGKMGNASAITESGRTIVGNVGSSAVRWRDGRLQTLDSLAPQRRGWHLAKLFGMTPNGTMFGIADRGSSVAVFALTAP